MTSGRGVDDWTINYIGRQAKYRLPIYSCSVINTRRCKQRSTEPELLTHFHFFKFVIFQIPWKAVIMDLDVEIMQVQEKIYCAEKEVT